MAVSCPPGVKLAERAINKALAPKKKRLQRPERKRPPTEAALLFDDAAITHEFVVSINLPGKSRPTLGKIFQNLGFNLTLR
jgi:hypothetical protein